LHPILDRIKIWGDEIFSQKQLILKPAVIPTKQTKSDRKVVTQLPAETANKTIAEAKKPSGTLPPKIHSLLIFND